MTDSNGKLTIRPATAAIAASIAAAVGTFVTLAITHGQNLQQLKENTIAISAMAQTDLRHDQSIAVLSGDIKEIKRDVSWIRAALRKGEQP